MAKIRPDDDDRFGMQTSAETKLANKNKNRNNKTKNNLKKIKISEMPADRACRQPARNPKPKP